MLSNNFDIQIQNAPPLHSTSNGQVERFHSTLIEIARCIKLSKKFENTTELILMATIEYNKTIHSVTGKRPIDLVRSLPADLEAEVRNKIQEAQNRCIGRENKKRKDKQYQVGEKVLVKSNKRLGNKLTPLYVEEVVEADLGTTVLIKGRKVHKDSLK